MLTRFASLFIVTTIGLASQDVLRGTYDARLTGDPYVNIMLRGNGEFGSWGRSLDRSQIRDLQISDAGISFRLARDAGDLKFVGRGTENKSRGDFEFTPSASYRRQLGQLGLGNATLKELFIFAMSDLSIADIKYLEQATADDLSAARLAKMMNHGANLQFVRDLEAAGFRHLDSGELIETRNHGVDGDYIAAMRKHGHRLTLEQYIDARNHGVSVDFITEMKEAGLRLSFDQLIRARNHGVTGDYIADLAEVGYKDLSLNDYIRLRNHGIGAGFARKMNREHGEKLDVSELIRLRNRGH